MKFSTIIPSFNSVTFIANTIESIIQQKFADFEIIVVDNKSTDGTLAILEFYQSKIGERFRYFHEKDRGFAHAVNKGLSVAEGDILSIQSSDDYYAPGAFEAVARVYQNERPLLVSGDRIVVDEKLKIIRQMNNCREINITNLLMDEVVLFQDATFFSREAYLQVGPLASTVDLVADYDYWIKILSLGQGVLLNKVLSFYVLHSNQRTQLRKKQFGDDYELCILNWLDSDFYSRLSNELPRQIPLASILLKKAYWYNAAGKKSLACGFIEDAFSQYQFCKSWPSFRNAVYRSGGFPLYLKHYGIRMFLVKVLKKFLTITQNSRTNCHSEALDPKWLCCKGID